MSSSALIGPEQEARWRQRIREALFVPDPLPPLERQFHGQFAPEPGVVVERVSYATQFGMRIPAILYRPDPLPAPRLPALIVVNGHGGDKFSWYPHYSGILYARAGGVVLTYDPTGEGERNAERQSGTREHDRIEPPDELAQRLAGLMLTDLMQAVSYLRQRPDVDPWRIAAAGYSMGSLVLAFGGAVELRLRACALVGGGNLDGPGEYWDRAKPMCTGIPYRALSFLGDRAAALYVLQASRGPTLLYNGMEDEVVNIPATGEPFLRDMRQRAAALRGGEDGLFEYGFCPGASHRPHFVSKPVALWLHRQLAFPRWSEGAIAAMPETHVSEWAAKTGAATDPFYATEHREGGTMALDTGIPGLTREQLCVYGADEWERLKPRLVHETWRVEARRRIAEKG